MLQRSYEILVFFLGLEDPKGVVMLSLKAQKAKLGYELLLLEPLNGNKNISRILTRNP